MALKSETLQTPVFVGVFSHKIDDKTSGEEDLEDGEIFDDEDEGHDERKEKSENKGSSSAKTENKTEQSDAAGTISENDSGKLSNKDSVVNLLMTAAAVSSNVASSNSYPHTPWKKHTAFGTLEDSNEKKKKKKKKRKRTENDDNGGENEGEKKKKLRKNTDKDASGLDGGVDKNTFDNEMLMDDEDNDNDDDDEMLFIRGASPQRFHYGSRFPDGFQSDGDNDDIDCDFEDDDEDYLDENDDEIDEIDGERRSGFNSRLDRGARRDRITRGKRRGRGNIMMRKKRDDRDICIFYMQGNCHKGSDCQFSHEALPHKKQELCKFYLMDCCNKKEKCLYMHSEFPCKYYHMGLKCYANKSCKFSHAKLSESMRQVFIKTFGPIRSKGEFPNKKAPPSNKHGRQQESGGEFNRPREGRRDGGGDNSREKKIPSLFDIKVSIPDEMRRDYNSDSDEEGGNHTPMPSPPHGQGVMAQHVSDSSRSPPSSDMGPMGMPPRRRRKEKRSERPRKGGGQRGNEGDTGLKSRRGPMSGQFGNCNWDEDDQITTGQFHGDDSTNSNSNNTCNNNNLGNNDSSAGSNNRDFLENSDFSNRIGGILQAYHKQQHCDSDESNSNKYDASGSAQDPMMSHDEVNAAGSHASAFTNDNSNEMFPAHLPKKQRELFMRIQQQQRQASETTTRQHTGDDAAEDSIGTNEGKSGEQNSSVDSNSIQNGETATSNIKNLGTKFNTDQDWYSSDEDDNQPTNNQIPPASNSSISAILQNLFNNQSNSSSNPNTIQQMNVFGSMQPTNTMIDSGSANSNTAVPGISNVDFDVNEVSELLSKVKQHFQASERRNQEKRRDPRLRSDVGPSGDSPISGSGTSTTNSIIDSSSTFGQLHNDSRVSALPGNDDGDLRSNAIGTRGVGAGDMDLRNLPFKPAPVHSAATEIDASINSHNPMPYRLIPFIVPKPDYTTVQPNSKVGAADPRLRKSLRLSEDTNAAVSSRDPRHRLIDDINKNKTNAPPTQNTDPRQRSRMMPGQQPGLLNSSNMNDEQQMPGIILPPSLSHVRPSYPMMPGPDMGMMCPPTPRINDDPMQSYGPSPVIAPPQITRPTDPRQRHSQANLPLPTTQPQGAALFDALAMNSRQQGFLAQTGDPRSRPPGVPNMVFPGAVRSNDSMNKGQFGFK